MAWSRSYVDGLGLELDDVAFVNVAWRATNNNAYPRMMLRHGFDRHTGPFLTLLRPEVVIAAGTVAQSFERDVRAILPKTKVIPIFHHAHREGRAAGQQNIERVRSVLHKAGVQRPSNRNDC
jgi:hypothetical protein